MKVKSAEKDMLLACRMIGFHPTEIKAIISNGVCKFYIGDGTRTTVKAMLESDLDSGFSLSLLARAAVEEFR